MPSLSSEQQRVYETVLAGHDTYVDACFGSGKTTTISAIYRALIQEHGRKCLYLTYSRLLKLDAQQKVALPNTPGSKVTNFHGFVYPYLQQAKIPSSLDTSIYDFNQNFDTIAAFIEPFDVILVDECQDLNGEFAQLITHLKSINPLATMVFVGDMEQKIHNNSSLDVPTFIQSVTNDLVHLTLSQSFRAGPELTSKLSVGWEKPITGANLEQKISYMSPNEALSLAAQTAPGQLLVLGKRNGQAAEMLNALEEVKPEIFNKSTVYATVSDARSTPPVDDQTAIFTTFDACKGMERATVIVFDFTERYWEARTRWPSSNPTIMRNLFLVAASRAKDHLIFVTDDPVEPGPDMLADISLSTFVHRLDPTVPDYSDRPLDGSSCLSFKFAEDVQKLSTMIQRRTINQAHEPYRWPTHDGTIDLSSVLVTLATGLHFNEVSTRYLALETINSPLCSDLERVHELVDKRLEYVSSFLDKEFTWACAQAVASTGYERYLTQVNLQFVSPATAASLSKALAEHIEPSAARAAIQPIVGRAAGKLNGEKISSEISIHPLAPMIDDQETYWLINGSEETGSIDAASAALTSLVYDVPVRVLNLPTGAVEEITVPNPNRLMHQVIKTISMGVYSAFEPR